MKNKNYIRMVVTILIMILGVVNSINAQSTNLRWAASSEGFEIKSLYLDKNDNVKASPYSFASLIGVDVYSTTEHSVLKNGSSMFTFPDSVFIGAASATNDGMIITTYENVYVSSLNMYIISNEKVWEFKKNTNTVSFVASVSNMWHFSVKGNTKNLIGWNGLKVFDNNTHTLSSTTYNVPGIMAYSLAAKHNSDTFYVAYQVSDGSSKIFQFYNGIFTEIAHTTPGVFMQIGNISVYDTVLYAYGPENLTTFSGASGSNIGQNNLYRINLNTGDISIITHPTEPVFMSVGKDSKLVLSDGFSLFSMDNTSVGIHDIEQQKISIYPNPTTDFITISGYDKEVSVYSIMGTLVANGNERIDISRIESGIYFVKTKDGQYLTKFVKK